MTKTKLNLLTALCLALSITGCSQETMEPPATDPYEPCCGTEPVEFTLGDDYVFVPNAFTPNGDGINDIFVPWTNKDSVTISNFTILSAVGDTVLFQRPTLSDFQADAWDGFRPDGSAYKGFFRYRMEISNGGALPMLIQGGACRIVCGPDAAIFKTKGGCFYPGQINNDGRLDATLPSYEEGCFE